MDSDWQSLLGVTDWSTLSHAYGSAAETPEQIRALVRSDPDDRMNAVEHLWGAVLHQGTIYPVTPFVARIVAEMLCDEALASPARSIFDEADAEGAPVRDSVLMFLKELAESAAFAAKSVRSADFRMVETDRVREIRAGQWTDDDFSDPEFEQIYDALLTEAAAQCVSDAGSYLQAARPWMLAERQSTRSCAIAACAALSVLVAPSETGEVEAAFRHAAANNAEDRLGLVLALSAMNADTSDFLQSEDQRVRFAAALSDGIPAPAALEVLIESLHHYAQLDSWYDDFRESFDGWPRFAFTQQACRRAPHFDSLASVAPIVAQHGAYPDSDWGHLLTLAFPDKWSDELTENQRAFVRALVQAEGVWSIAGGGNRDLAFMKIGLPTDREVLKAIVDRPNPMTATARS